MQSYKQANNDDTIALAFHSSATRTTKVFHPWRYFVAGGETLAKINELIASAEQSPERKAELAQKAGAKSFNGFGFDFEYQPDELKAPKGKERVDWKFDGGAGREPYQGRRVERIEGFVLSEDPGYPAFLPDVSTAKGRAFRDAARELVEQSNPAKAFAKWLGASDVFVPTDIAETAEGTRLSATVTKVGKEWIVAVPVSVSGGLTGGYGEQWAVPPGSKPLTVAQYFTRVEKAQLLKNMPSV